jgi:DNA polymerase
MVVGDWPVAGQGSTPSLLMGPEEDVMLEKMMAAIGLSPEQYCVTNVLKCCPAAGQEVAPAWGQTCASFLQREIGIIRPAIICAMGEIAARALLGGAEPLLRLRGRFTPCRYQDDPPIPVMPTFHPRFLLANPEMKMAAWKDLQAVQRRLAQVGQATRHP